MTLDEAIEVLANPPTWLRRNASIDYLDAAKLGIEALKRLKQYREFHRSTADGLLPGETEE